MTDVLGVQDMHNITSGPWDNVMATNFNFVSCIVIAETFWSLKHVIGVVVVITRVVEPELKTLGSDSRHLNIFALAPERFGPLKTKSHCIICTTHMPHKLCL